MFYLYLFIFLLGLDVPILTVHVHNRERPVSNYSVNARVLRNRKHAHVDAYFAQVTCNTNNVPFARWLMVSNGTVANVWIAPCFGGQQTVCPVFTVSPGRQKKPPTSQPDSFYCFHSYCWNCCTKRYMATRKDLAYAQKATWIPISFTSPPPRTRTAPELPLAQRLSSWSWEEKMKLKEKKPKKKKNHPCLAWC